MILANFREHDLRARPEEHHGLAEADAAAPTRDERRLAVEFLHCNSPGARSMTAMIASRARDTFASDVSMTLAGLAA